MTIKPLYKYTKKELADEFGELHVELAPKLEQLDKLKKEMVKRGVGDFLGTKYQTTVTEVESVRLKTDLVKDYLTKQGLLKKYVSVQKFFRVCTPTARKATKAA